MPDPIYCEPDAQAFLHPLTAVVAHAAFNVRAQQWSDAVLLLTRFAAACDGANMRSSQCRAYLSAVVVLLYAQDILQAFNVYQVSNYAPLSSLVFQQPPVLSSLPCLIRASSTIFLRDLRWSRTL